jgi:ABC-type multidrug transport system ATPase subunit/pSer/pThr/pTyr-binding forkhead associated (FHA) protein
MPDLVVRTQRSAHEFLAGNTYRIGRDPESDILMTDSRVSWRHGVLRVDRDGWILEDLNSTNGTFLGPQRVDRVDISQDCVIRLGHPDDGPILRCMPQLPASAVPAPQAPQAPPTPSDPAPETPAQWDPTPETPAQWEPTPETPAQWEPAAEAPAQWTPSPEAEAAPPRGAESWYEPPEDYSPRPPAAPPRPPADSPRPPAAAPRPLAEPPRPPAPAWAEPVPAKPSMLPSVDRRPTARMPLPAKAMSIGRTPDNDLVLSDLDVSRYHAELRKSSTGSYEIVDKGSHNGTFVNGQRITRKLLTEDDLVSIGHSTFRLTDGELRQFVDDGEVTFTAQDLVVKVSGGKILLDHVSFPIPERCLLGVIGPSGAGKSTLLGALTGMRPATTGTVLYDNRDLYQDYAELRCRIGLVPQESVLHTQLTARRALQYSAELRFPADTTSAERDVRVDEVMGELGLTKHANTRADRLSGGQLKRVNVAQELLTKPSLLFLDEPTSGLDPGLDKSVMEQMRDLAHDGRTVIVVTHSVDNLDTCDRLLVLVPGGRIAFYGPPTEGLSFFGQSRWAEVFQDFERYPDRDWAAEYAASPACAQYVLGQRTRTPQVSDNQEVAPATPPPQQRSAYRQMTTLTRRYLRVIASDRGYLISMAVAPFILGGLIHLLGNKQGLAGPAGTNANASTVLVILVVCACLSGAASSIWELVKERSIYIRERAAGLSSGAYLASKVLVLGVICVVQSIIIVFVGLLGEKMPAQGAIGGIPPLVEIMVGMAILSLASMCLGLLVSALVSTAEKAVPFLVMITFAQVILSGGLVKVAGKAGLAQIAWFAPSRWGYAALASTANLNVTTPRGAINDPAWNQTAATWLHDMGFLVGLIVLFLLITWVFLRRLGPRRRKA